ncbi:MAG: SpoIIIAH-like family protein [Clostridia bacterium]|nr:SpoIIIAH-like family protein [Clostridia bacterium]
MKVTYINLFNKQKKSLHVKKKNRHSKEKRIDLVSKLKNIVKNNKFSELLSKKIIKKNQLALIATSLMLVTAGYLNYINTIKVGALGDAQLVSTNVLESENSFFKDEEPAIETSTNVSDNQGEDFDEHNNEETDDEYNEEKVTKTSTNNTKIKDDYFTKTKLERETMYSQMLETYQKILENNNIPDDQKSIASNEIRLINERKGAITTIENLIKIKGFEDLAVLINGNSVNVVVKVEENLESTQVAQIQNIVSRELNTEIEDIHITTHK